MSDQAYTGGKIRVLIIAPSFAILGGQSVQAARLRERLEKEPSLEIGFLPINPRLPGPLNYLQKITYVRTVVTSIAYVLSLLVRVPSYDVLHVFSASYFSFVIAPTPAIVIGKLLGKKVLLNYHSGEAEDHLQRWRQTAIPTIRLADIIVVPSVYLARIFGKFGLPASAINNLVDTSKFHYRDRVPLRPIFLSNRNLEVHYGVDRVLRAFAIVQESFKDARLTVVGDGSQRVPLETLAKELELRDVSFVGRVSPDSIFDSYAAADIYLNGSEIDNQPLSLLEAFACGIPIVTTDAGGIPDIVENERTGLIVPRGDYEQMAKRAIRLLSDPETSRRLINEARKECQKYSWAAVRNGWMNSYRELMNLAPESNSLTNGVQSEPDKALTR
jgi:L-malate glycosyltransferase